MEYERFYPAPPARVFASLVHALGDLGRVRTIEGNGRQATFVTTRSAWKHTLLLRAWVSRCPGGTLLQVQGPDSEVLTEDQDQAELARLMHLLDVVGDRLSSAQGAPGRSGP